jgi:hypothetical protein
MRKYWWACICVGVLTGAAAFQHFTQPSLPTGSPGAPEPSERHAVEPASKDEARLQQVGPADADLETEQSSGAPKDVAPEAERSELKDTKPDLTYLAYYAYSEIPPDPKPADTILNLLKDTPPGTPIDEIRVVSDLLGSDVTFMKTVAKIESGFNPQQRTGSYIGLYQLSKREFGLYGSGDILAPRDNTIAAVMKFKTEAALFEIFTHKKPTLDDLYLIHQQGIDGAAQHVSHPHRLAWRSMCATDEGREKGEKWCKLAIWGNTFPAVKRIWKNVNNVTSADFIAMWQERLATLYARYSEPAFSAASTPTAAVGSQGLAKAK